MPRLPRLQDGHAIYHVVTRVHLNPCSGGKPLVASPELYPYSSYANYAGKTRRVDWIDYVQHHRYRITTTVQGIWSGGQNVRGITS